MIQNELDKIDKKLKTALSKMDRATLAALIEDDEQWRLFIEKIGLNDFILSLDKDLKKIFIQKARKLSNLKYFEDKIERVNQVMTRVVNSNERTIVGYITANAENIRSKLYNSVIGGNTSRATIEAILDASPLHSRSQVGAVINTAYSDIERLTTKQIYEGENKRFIYTGGVIPTSSPQCEWLINNQDPEGYTMEEINSGINTPFGVIDWFGRQPNYNCIHTWEAL